MKVGVLFRDETAWLTQRALAELFGVGVAAINEHLKNIFESGELDREATISKMEIVPSESGREVARTIVSAAGRMQIRTVTRRPESHEAGEPLGTGYRPVGGQRGGPVMPVLPASSRRRGAG